MGKKLYYMINKLKKNPILFEFKIIHAYQCTLKHYRIAGNFCGVKNSLFLWVSDLHEILTQAWLTRTYECSAGNETKRNCYSRKPSFSNFLPHENYPLYGNYGFLLCVAYQIVEDASSDCVPNQSHGLVPL